jgi:hypothetical protein
VKRRHRSAGTPSSAPATTALKAPAALEAWLRMLTEVAELKTADAALALGDTLPIGLRLG